MSIETKDLVNLVKRRPVVCLCFVIVFAVGMGYYFRMGAVDELSTQLEERSKVLRKLSTNVKHAVQLEQQVAALRAVNKSIADSAFREGELALNQQLFLRLETETGVKLIDLRALPVPAKGAADNPFVPLGFSISVTGTYQQLITFLKRFERSATLGRVANASISGPDADIHTLNLNVEMLGMRR